MKKVIALLLCAMMMFALIGCGGSSSDNQGSDPMPEPAPAPIPAQGNVKVGFIYLHDEQSTYDLNFLEAARIACDAAGVEHIDKTGIAEGNDCYEAAADLVDRGCTIVFADSFGHEDYLIQAAKEFPNVQFCYATGTQAHTENLPNFHNAFAAIYEGRYLAGIAAGMKLNEMIAAGEFSEDEASIGYIGAYPYAEVKSGYTSFFLGARSVCPSATMKVVFTNSWYDEALEKEGATRLIQAGCKLISQHADSMGAPSACESAGVPNVSYNGSTISACPNTFIVSSNINWVPYFIYIINCVQNGKPIATDWTGTIDTGSVELTELNDKVAAKGTAEAIETAKAEMQAGKLRVFDTSTWTVDGNEMASYLADVDSDPAYTADTNVIFDGYFHESEFRSAPYFDLAIDGIEILD
jgi:basic membrane protein A